MVTYLRNLSYFRISSLFFHTYIALSVIVHLADTHLILHYLLKYPSLFNVLLPVFSDTEIGPFSLKIPFSFKLRLQFSQRIGKFALCLSDQKTFSIVSVSLKQHKNCKQWTCTYLRYHQTIYICLI